MQDNAKSKNNCSGLFGQEILPNRDIRVYGQMNIRRFSASFGWFSVTSSPDILRNGIGYMSILLKQNLF